MFNPVVILLFLYLLISIYRYMTLMQKEHYIPGTCLKFKIRWSLKSMYMVPIFSKSFRPKFTNRFTRLLIAVLIINAFLIAIAGYLVGVLLCIVLQFLIIDLTSFPMKFIEDKLSNKFVKQAKNRLRKVSPTVVGITGSYGKTSTKNHLKELLTGSRQVIATPASWNNKGGISRSVNEYLEDGTEIFIAEMGMYKIGEIASLCEWVKPTISIITAIGSSHLERIGSVENIIRAKSEILNTADTVVLWVSDENLDNLSQSISGKRVIRCGYDVKPQLEVKVSNGEEEIIFSDKNDNEIARISAASELHESNIACALGALIALDVPLKNLKDKVSNLSTPEHRATVGKADKGYVVIDNTFNSNLEGAKSNIAKLSAEIKNGNKYVVTPGLVELGSKQKQSNYELGKAIARSGAELVATHYTNCFSLINGAQDSGGKTHFFKNRENAVKWIRKNINAQDGVLYENDLPIYYP